MEKIKDEIKRLKAVAEKLYALAHCPEADEITSVYIALTKKEGKSNVKSKTKKL